MTDPSTGYDIHAIETMKTGGNLDEEGCGTAPPAARAAVPTVVTLSLGATGARDGHEASTRHEIGRRLAALTGAEYAGEYDSRAQFATPPYFVPSDTLTSGMAAQFGLRDERELFGGVVPHAFVATKTITHPLPDETAQSPAGWRAEFPRAVAGVVLDGYSAFAKADALRAGRVLLERGTVRIKLASGIAGMGQFTAENARELERVFEALDFDEIARCGLVVEENLLDVTTYSVGQVRVDDLVASYYGTQYLTRNNRGAEVYGGSEITVVRGDFKALLARQLVADVRLAITQACTYDAAATRCFEGFYASRRNYDVAQGVDAVGRRRSGVLEQSWRLGGASGAEVGALQAFRADPSLHAVHATSREIYGEPPALPADAVVYFSGIDPRVGLLTKFTVIEPHADAR